MNGMEETEQKATPKLSLRRKIQQLQDDKEKMKNENQVTHNTFAQVTYPRNFETARTTEATSNTANFETHGSTTSTPTAEKNSTLFGTQVRPSREERSPTEPQAGRAAPPKNILASQEITTSQC